MSSQATSLPGPALQASKAALSSVIAESEKAEKAVNGSAKSEEGKEDLEDGEIQEVDMEGQAESIRTVFNDATNFNVKHPLYSPWTLWFDSPATKGRNFPATPSTAFPPTPTLASVPPTPGGNVGGGWMEDIKKVITIDSVEEFWGLYNNIVPPSQLPQKANYYLFKEGIIPAWEDDANKNGGKWSIQLPKDKNRGNVDKMWLNTMLAAIGETFDHSEESDLPSVITGVIVSTRPQFYRLSIWTRVAPSSNENEAKDGARERIESIGRHFKMGVLGYNESQKLAGPLATEVEFMSHKDSEKKGKGKKIVV